MPASAHKNLDSGCPRRSTRFKDIHVVYEDSDRDPSSFKRIKTEVIDSELSVGSVSDKDSEHNCHDVLLKDLRTQCKAKNRKISKITLEGCGIKNQVKTEDDIDLDKPIVALKQKRLKTSPAKANIKMDALRSSPCAAKEKDTTSARDKILSSAQTFLLKATMQDRGLEKPGRRIAELEQSKVVIDSAEEIVGEQIYCAEVNNTAGVLAGCVKPDVLYEIKTEDTNYSEFGTSMCSIKNPDHSSFELQQKLVDDDDCVPPFCFMTRPAQLADVSDHSCEQTCSSKENNSDDITAAKATDVVSSLDLTDEVRNHQKTSENITNLDVDKSSTANGLMASFSESCHDRIDKDEQWNLFAHGNEPAKILEELSPIDESSTDTQSDLCRSTEMNFTSLEGVVRMEAEGQLDSIVCCGVRPKHMLLDMEIGHTATGTFTFDKTIDLAHPANFVAQDGRLESIVYDVLNNHAQRTTSKSKSSVGLPDTAVLQSSLIEFTDNCLEDKRASDDKFSHPNNVDLPLKDTLNSTIDYDICRSINNEGSEEEIVPQHQLYQSCSDKFNLSSVMPEISNAEKSQKLSAGTQNSSATSLETDGRIKRPNFFVDEESIEEHAPKVLLSKRKIMSPTSQEKLYSAVTGIDLCDGVQRSSKRLYAVRFKYFYKISCNHSFLLQIAKSLLKIVTKLQYHCLSQHTCKANQCSTQTGDLRTGHLSPLQAKDF
ncbi:hypothetical protein ZEAMMB73_Zm00001d029647 [Zea mays]|uniref:Uncharacterized protein n=1 Tax=Zea mays TaxID=4577 RepID=A0A1D6K6T9_MAIZE|nr:hypothetical protein ZEAMMB73_Zm00001d029647 [Zea mays]